VLSIDLLRKEKEGDPRHFGPRADALEDILCRSRLRGEKAPLVALIIYGKE
jgi:hypothetical protein